jgi:hypothetical protein
MNIPSLDAGELPVLAMHDCSGERRHADAEATRVLTEIEEKRIRFWHYVAAAVMTVLCMSVEATSRMGRAVVTESNGLPCFAVPSDAETLGGIPLYDLLVSEPKSRDWKALPDELWGFAIEPPGYSIAVLPQNCIRYGNTPNSAKQRTLKPLQPFHVYAVSIGARPKDSGVIGYNAEFCLKPANDGRMTVQVIEWDRITRKWQYDVCAKP